MKHDSPPRQDDKPFFDTMTSSSEFTLERVGRKHHRTSIGRKSIPENYLSVPTTAVEPTHSRTTRGMSTSARRPDRTLSVSIALPETDEPAHPNTTDRRRVSTYEHREQRRKSIAERRESMAVGKMVDTQDACIQFVCHDGRRVPFKDGIKIPESAVIGRGAQGKVYLVEVVDSAGQVIRQCVLKTLLKSADVANAFSGHAAISAQAESSFDHKISYLLGKYTHAEVDSDSDNSDDEIAVTETVFALTPLFPLFFDDVIEPLNTLQASNPKLALTATTHMLRDLLTALKEIDRKGYAHADVKPANVAVSVERSNAYCIMIDMDGALSQADEVKQFTGTPAYTHPGCFSDSQLCNKTCNDIYSLGMALKQALGDVSAIAWMAHWESIKDSHNVVYETSKLQSAKYEAYLEAAEQGRITKLPDDLTTRLSRLPDVKAKLVHIADSMACFSLATNLDDHEALSAGKPSMLDQPSIDELIACTASVIAELEASNMLATSAELKSFYLDIISAKTATKAAEEVVSAALSTAEGLLQEERATSHTYFSGDLYNNETLRRVSVFNERRRSFDPETERRSNTAPLCRSPLQ